MKIGIMTYWDSQDNYGQLLQCYALQRYLSIIGHDPYIIKYSSDIKSKFRLSKLHPINIINFLKIRLKKYFHSENKIKRDFTSFRSHIKYSELTYKGLSELVDENWSDTDAFICGSDQIWSPKPIEALQAYYLKFTPFQKKKIAYAPSFGRKQLDENYIRILPDLLKDFDNISVRESSGVDMIVNAGREAELVCDPTLLLDEKIYRNEFALDSNPENTCFCYFINWDTDIEENSLLEFCNANNLEPRLFCTKGYKSKIRQNSLQSPEEWLTTLSNSRFSAVNSFHGLVFSILFHIPFAVYLLKGEQAAMNGRIHSLLELLDLSNRVVSTENQLEDIYSRSIDWELVDNKIKNLRDLSIKFLDSALNEPQDIKYDKKYNICFMTAGAVHHRYGGLDRVTEILADRFATDGHNVYYISFYKREKYNSKRQYFLPDANNTFSPDNSKYLTDFLRDKQIDILINQEGNVNRCILFDGRENVKALTCLHFNPNYIDNNHFFAKFSTSPFPARILAKIIFSIKPINDLGLKYLRNKLSKNYIKNLQWCDKFILLSPRFAKTLTSLVDSDLNLTKIESIHNPNTIIPKQYDDKEKIILYAGRLDKNFKRLDTLIDDVSEVLGNNPQWRMVICGDGPDKEYLMKKAHKKNASIEFIGYCNPTEYYKKASIIVLRSISEGWGMVLVEAMSYGVVPVVAETYASLKDIIDNERNGLITQDKDEAFCSALDSLLRDPEKIQAMSSKAVIKAATFNTDSIVKEWYKLFSL